MSDKNNPRPSLSAGANFRPDTLELGEASFQLIDLGVSAEIKFTGLANPLTPEQCYDLAAPMARALRAKIEQRANEEIHAADRIG